MAKQIPLTQGQVALVDDEDYEWLMQFKWWANRVAHSKRAEKIYFATTSRTLPNKKRTTVCMHRLIMNAPKGVEVDHKDHNPLNCQRSNLRLATRIQNAQNRRSDLDNKCGYKGVWKCKFRGNYKARIRANKKTYDLGRFPTAIEAAKAYNEAATRLHGEFAWLNDVEEDDAMESATNGRQTQIKERPILFSGPMVQAIRDGRKTQTRRVVTFLPQYADAQYVRVKYDDRISKYDPILAITHKDAFAACPYGVPGERLWVRETFLDGDDYPCYEGTDRFTYRADVPDDAAKALTWQPSIFMPRIASRITLEIESVRVERLQEITEEGAEAEGVSSSFAGSFEISARTVFEGLWTKINGKKYPWSSNPWVWVISFRKTSQ